MVNRIRNLTATTILAGLLIATGLTAAAAPANAAGGVYDVSPSGNDSAAGSAAAPFKTIQHCADVAAPGDTCRMATGTYRETVTPPTSGTSGAPITFEAAPGASVTVDGTDAVTGWTLDSGNVYKASVVLAGTVSSLYSSAPNPSNADLWANQVFTGSAPIPEAAYPAAGTGVWDKGYVSSGWSGARTSGGTCPTAPCTSTGTGTLTYSGFPALGDMTGATLQLSGYWTSTTSTVGSGNLNGTNKTLQLVFQNSDNPVMIGGGSTKFRLVGKKSFLTSPNQWFYDPSSQQLYVWAADGQQPQNISAKKRNYGFDLSSRSNIQVENIAVFGTTIRTDDSSSNIVLDGIDAKYVSEWQTTQYDSSLPYAGVYAGNHRADSGIILHGSNNRLSNSRIQYSGGAGVSLKGAGHVVRNNLIRDIAYDGTYAAAVTVESGVSASSIVGNTMRSMGRDAINMNTNAFPNPGYDLRIAYNDISDYAKTAYDLGAIYSCCDTSLRGRIDHNTIHDPAQIGNGVHFDNGTYDVNVDHNVFWGLKGGVPVAQGGWSAGHSLPYLTGSYVNNTMYAGAGWTIQNYYATAAQVANTTTRNNILDGTAPSGQTYNYIAGGSPNQVGNLVTSYSANPTASLPNPFYAGAGTGNFTLLSTSAAINAGVAVAGITDGYAGSAPDQGAYENGQATWLTGCTIAPECGSASTARVTLVAHNSGKDVGVTGSAAQATQQTDSGSSSQQWALLSQSDGSVQIKNVATGQCLAVTGASTANGASVVQWSCSTAPHFLWNVQESTGGYQQLVSVNSGKCLAVDGGGTADGANLVQYTCQGSPNEQFTIQPVNTNTTIDDASAQITYAGTWTHDAAKSWSNADIAGTESYSNVPGNTASFTFTGTGVQLAAPIGQNMGIMTVSVDGGTPTSVDLYVSAKQYQQIVFQKSGLSTGSHTVTVRATGLKNAASTNTYAGLDAFTVLSN